LAVSGQASDELPLEPLEVANQIADLTGVQPEFGHTWMTGDNAFAKRFFECFDRITL
jgi:hypothetical protein